MRGNAVLRAAGMVALAILPAASAAAAGLEFPVSAPAVPSRPQACDASMPGGFILPGTDACLRIGGVLRADAGLRFTSAARLAPPSFAWTATGPAALPNVTQTSTPLGAQARLSADLRTNTSYGPLRVFVSIRSDRRR